MKYLWLCWMLSLMGCASNSLFEPYPTQLQLARQSLATGQFQSVLPALAAERDSADGLLYLMEHGRLSQLKGDFATSLADFRQALSLFEQQQQGAKIRAGRLLSQTGSLLTNDNSIPYQGATYELLLLHCFQALNYLSLKRPESAQVELRQAYAQQKEARAVNQAEVERAKAEARAYASESQMQQILQRWSGSGTELAAFNSGYAYLLSALLYEVQKNPNEALIDYQKALELYPDNQYLQQDVRRLALSLGRRELLPESMSSTQIRPRPDQGRMVVVIEQDVISAKSSIQLPLFFNRGYQQLTLPYYPPISPIEAPRIATAARFLPTALLDNVQQMAVWELSERMPILLARQLARMYSKGGLQHQMSRNMGVSGDVASILYTLVSEQADLRSWLTLPQAIFYRSGFEQAGIQNIQVQSRGRQWSLQIPVIAGRTVLVRLNIVGQRLQQQIFQL